MKNNKPLARKWPIIWSLALLNASVVISWIAYHNYQPQIIKGFGLKDLNTFLIWAQAIILVIIPPISGFISDRIVKNNGKKLLVFTIGTSVTAMVFMIVASMVQIGPGEMITFALPFMIAIWLISMNIFHSPANSFLESMVESADLPLAMALIIFINDMLYALEPIIVEIIQQIGGPITFASGGILLTLSGILFFRTIKSMPVQPANQHIEEKESNLFFVFMIGITLGIVITFLNDYLPYFLVRKLPEFNSQYFNGGHFSSIILFGAAAFAFPASMFTNPKRIQDVVFGSVIIICISIPLIIYSNNSAVVKLTALVFTAAFSTLSVLSFPLAIKNMSRDQITLGTGIFFGSLEIATGISNIIQGTI